MTQLAQERATSIVRAAEDLFGVHPDESWPQVQGRFNDKHILQFYEVVRDAWWRFADPREVLPSPNNTFRTVYVADKPRKSLIARDVARMSLVADEIVLLGPLPDPWVLQMPDLASGVAFDTYKHAKLLCQLAPWISAGIVTLAPDVAAVNSDVRRQIDEAEAAAMKTLKPKESIVARLKRRLAPNRTNVEPPPEAVEKFLLQRIGPRPWSDEPEPPEAGGRLKGDVDLARVVFSAAMAGATPLTCSSLAITSDLNSLGVGAPKTDSFAPAMVSVDLPLLDNVDLSFALKMRREGRASAFRAALWDVWSSADVTSLEKRELFGDVFRQRMQQSVASTKADWDEIDVQLIKWGGPAVAGAIAAGALALSAPAAGAAFVVSGVTMLVASQWKRHSFSGKESFIGSFGSFSPQTVSRAGCIRRARRIAGRGCRSWS